MGVSPTLCRNYGMTLNGPQYAFLGAHPSTAWTEVSQLLRPWVDSQTPNAVFGVKIDTTPGYTFHAVLPTLRVWWDRQSTVPALTAPVGDATITSLTPTLSWGASTDPDAGENPPNYEVVLMGNKPATTPGDAFELSGCSAGATRVWSSGYGSATSAVVPAGLLNDGASYYWAVAAIGGGGIDRFPRCSEVRKFTVNRRLGVSGPFPVEQLGPVGVNVINGNVVIGASTHSYATVGGEQSLSLVYNSQATNDRGLRGRYYGGKYPLFGAEIDVWNGSGALFVDRLDPTVDFAWGSGSPVTTMDAMDDFRVTWSGYVTPGVAGTYCFGGTFDEGVKITINGVVVLNKWQHQSATFNCSNGGTAVVFGAGETKSIVVDYYEHTGAATAQLRVTKPDNSTVAVPSSWLSPDLDVLGPNWTLSAGEVAVQGAIKTDSGVMLRGVDGSATEYRKSDTGAYVGPGGDGTVVRVDPTTSEISVMDDAGTSYKFSASGQLQSAVSAVDDRQPAATQFQWSGAPVKLTAMVDPVTGSQSVLRYGGDANCPSVPSGFVSAPSKLCSVTSPDGRQTKLFYDASARLSRLVTPGDVTTDFAYDSSNRIIKVRDPLAFDAVSAGKRSDGDAVKWVIAYDGSGRASGVTAPAATAGATQQSSTLTYTAAATGQAFGQWGETRLSVSGLSQPNGYAKKVRFDDSFRTRESTDTAGFVTVTAYDGASDRVSYVDTMSGTAVAMRTSTVYDSAVVFNNLSRPVGAYGPAPVAKFQTNSPLPLATETGNVAATTTTYDGGLNGLAAAWFDDNAAGPFMTYPVRPAFVGAPKAHSLQSTSASWNWGAGSPDSSVGVDNWSGRLSGLVNLATAGSWRFRGTADDGVRVIVDDKVVMSGWDQPSVTVTGDPQTFGAGWHRIVIEVKENTGNASASVEWLAPGGSWAVIPAASLKPDLGLVTSTVGADGVTTTTGYSDPVGAKPTTVSVDPAGLNLTDTTGWEARGATGQYMRRTSRSLAAGSSSTNTYTYYGASETPSAPSCAGSGVSVTPVAQRGFAKTSGAADPTTSGGTGGLLREQIVDAAGRVVASRVSTDTKWSCVSYDSRGRATVTTSPASATAPGTAGNLPPSGTRSIAQHSGYCMNVRNGTATNGEVVEQYGCFTSGQPSEIFNYVDVDGTWFTIRPSHSSMCVGATGTSDAASVTQQTCAASSLQYWKAVAASNGYQLINQASGKCLQIADFNGSEGAAASVSSCITGWTNQQWKFVNPSTLNPEPFPTGSGPSSYPERTVTSVYAVGGDGQF